MLSSEVNTKVGAAALKKAKAEVAQRHGVKPSQVDDLMKRIGRNRKRSAFMADLCQTLHRNGWSVEAVCVAVGAFRATVTHFLKASPKPSTEGDPKIGAALPGESRRDRVGRLRKLGWCAREIAAAIGFSEAAVQFHLRAIRQGK